MNSLELLRIRHKDDVFVEECKSGPSQGVAHSRLDAWALRKTWSPITSIGYELKDSRQDFVRDGKWPNYLPLCHQLYFVCPPRLIGPTELPAECGLIWAHENRLLTKKKAPHRSIELPTGLLLYILMSRVQIVANMHQANAPDTRAGWRSWLELKVEDHALGVLVGGRMHSLMRELRAENERLKHEAGRLRAVSAELKRLGLPADAQSWQLGRVRRVVPEHLPAALRRLALQLEALRAEELGEPDA